MMLLASWFSLLSIIVHVESDRLMLMGTLCSCIDGKGGHKYK